ncbi:MAG: hypothetical protein WCD79_04870 [Chthoniobacteraceae bacterium]
MTKLEGRKSIASWRFGFVHGFAVFLSFMFQRRRFEEQEEQVKPPTSAHASRLLQESSISERLDLLWRAFTGLDWVGQF